MISYVLPGVDANRRPDVGGDPLDEVAELLEEEAEYAGAGVMLADRSLPADGPRASGPGSES